MTLDGPHIQQAERTPKPIGAICTLLASEPRKAGAADGRTPHAWKSGSPPPPPPPPALTASALQVSAGQEAGSCTPVSKREPELSDWEMVLLTGRAAPGEEARSAAARADVVAQTGGRVCFEMPGGGLFGSANPAAPSRDRHRPVGPSGLTRMSSWFPWYKPADSIQKQQQLSGGGTWLLLDNFESSLF